MPIICSRMDLIKDALYFYLKKYILENVSFKDITEKEFLNVVGMIYVLGWEDITANIEIISQLIY